MAQIHMVPFEQLSQEEIVEALKRYKAQNPKKYAAKKDALFLKYGIVDTVREEVEAKVEDEDDKELEAVAKVVKKAAARAKKTA